VIAPLIAVVITTASLPDSLSLDAALARARAMRSAGAVGASTIADARDALRAARQLPNPTASYSRSQSPPRQHLTLDQPLDWLLRRNLDIAAARAGLDAARSDSLAGMRDLEREVRIAYFRALATRESFRLADEQAAIAESLVTIASRRLAAGDISELERDQVALEAERARLSASNLREEMRVAESDLRRVLVWAPDAPMYLSDSLDKDLDAPHADSARVVANLPSVRSAVAESLSSALTLRSVRRPHFPIAGFEVGAEWDDPSEPHAGLQELVGVTVPIPLWHVGTREAELARAHAARDAAKAREARREAEQRVSESLVRLDEARRRAHAARDVLLPTARRIRTRAIKGYRAGETGVLPVLDALRTEREITQSVIDQLLSYQEAEATWKSLTGE
jgi:cobalt-zinc-cadmium efflux system outer membrane protein